MSTPAAITSGRAPWRPLRHRPLLVAGAVTAAAWAALFELHTAPAHQLQPGSLHAHLHSVMAQGPGDLPVLLAVFAAMPGWVLMCAAMMGLASLHAAHHVAVNSLRRRRHRAVAQFLAAYLVVWSLYGVVALTVVSAWPEGTRLPAVLAVAAAWQLAPMQRLAVRACHRTVPLPPHGAAAVRASMRYGLRHGLACVGSCWAMMLVMPAAGGQHAWWMAGLTAAVLAQKRLPRPGRTARILAVLLATAAVITALS